MAYLDTEDMEEDEFILCTTNDDVKKMLYNLLNNDLQNFKRDVNNIRDIDFTENFVRENIEKKKKILENAKYTLDIYSHCTSEQVFIHISSKSVIDKLLIQDIELQLRQIEEVRTQLKQIISCMKKVIDVDSEEERRVMIDNTMKKIVMMKI